MQTLAFAVISPKDLHAFLTHLIQGPIKLQLLPFFNLSPERRGGVGGLIVNSPLGFPEAGSVCLWITLALPLLVEGLYQQVALSSCLYPVFCWLGDS